MQIKLIPVQGKNLSKSLAKLMATIAILVGAQLSQAYEFKESTPEDVGYDSAKLAKVEELADKLYEDGRIPNYVLALYKDGNRYLTVTRGKTALEEGQDVDSDTIYHLASMSKPLVTTGIFRLAQDGKINLKDKLSKFFPAFAQMMVAPEGDFRNQFEPANREIEILDLVTHTSGFTYSENIAGFGDVGRTYSELSIFGFSGTRTMLEHMETLSEVPLVAQPGSEFNYSVSTDVLGAIIEQVTGKTLAAYLQEIIFTPLGMNSTGFSITPEQVPNMSNIFGGEPLTVDPNFKWIGKTSDSPDAIDWKIAGVIPAIVYINEPSFYSGGGGLMSSANDYARYLSMIAGNGSVDGVTVLTPEFAEKHKRSLVEIDVEGFRAAFGDAAEYMTFGGGFGIKNEPTDASKTDYIFWAGAFNTFFWLDLEDNSIGVFYTAHWPVQYNISDSIEQIVDEARR
ncbi:MAG: serine hydrolase [Emcibacteraceae bacterium]|nr:serine hydrolase [Emcibacteraceae bacterium]